MKFTSLAARINRCWKIGEESPVELPAGERTVELSRVYAHDSRCEFVVDESLRERGRVLSPDREQRLKPATRQQSLAICADILEEKIPKRKVLHVGKLSTDLRKRGVKGGLICVVRAVCRELDFEQRQPKSLHLRIKQRPTHPVDTDSVVIAGQARNEPGYVNRRIAAKGLQRQCAVLAAAPAENDFLRQSLWSLPRHELPHGIGHSGNRQVSRHYSRAPALQHSAR